MRCHAAAPPCPRCGSVRLIRRVALLRTPRLRDGIPLRLYLRSRRHQPRAIRRTTFLCQLYGHQWRLDELVENATAPLL